MDFNTKFIIISVGIYEFIDFKYIKYVQLIIMKIVILN